MAQDEPGDFAFAVIRQPRTESVVSQSKTPRLEDSCKASFFSGVQAEPREDEGRGARLLSFCQKSNKA